MSIYEKTSFDVINESAAPILLLNLQNPSVGLTTEQLPVGNRNLECQAPLLVSG